MLDLGQAVLVLLLQELQAGPEMDDGVVPLGNLKRQQPISNKLVLFSGLVFWSEWGLSQMQNNKIIPRCWTKSQHRTMGQKKSPKWKKKGRRGEPKTPNEDQRGRYKLRRTTSNVTTTD